MRISEAEGELAMRKHRMFDDRPGIIAMCLTGGIHLEVLRC